MSKKSNGNEQRYRDAYFLVFCLPIVATAAMNMCRKHIKYTHANSREQSTLTFKTAVKNEEMRTIYTKPTYGHH